eukprot:6204182-Pleurochrysis_carterae.AAC.1
MSTERPSGGFKEVGDEDDHSERGRKKDRHRHGEEQTVSMFIRFECMKEEERVRKSKSNVRTTKWRDMSQGRRERREGHEGETGGRLGSREVRAEAFRSPRSVAFVQLARTRVASGQTACSSHCAGAR